MFAPRYELREVIGEGGGGRVMAALDRARGVEVAFKRIPLSPEVLSHDAGVDVFRRELRALRAASGPHLVRLLDLGLGRDDEGRYGFHTSERLSAATLREWGRGRAWAEVEAVLAGPLGALSQLHDAGLMHGDLSAANVLVAEDGHATLIDLSCARPLGEALHTLDGTHPAPEIFEGARASVAIDLFALGELIAPWIGEAPPPAREFIARLRSPRAADRPDDVLEVFGELGWSPPKHRLATGELVGRDDELAALGAHVEAMRAGSAGPRVISIEGPAGIGKTRLVDALRWRVQLDVAVEEAAGPRPDHIARLLARIDADDLPRFRGRLGEPALLLVDDFDAAPAADQERLTRLARSLCATDPLIVVIVGSLEGPHVERTVLEPLSAEAVRTLLGSRIPREWRSRIVDAAAGVPADVELALRHAELDPRRVLAQGRTGGAVLERLDGAERRALLEVVAGGVPSSRIAAHALEAAGWLRYAEGAYRLTRPGDAGRVRGAATEEELAEVHRELAARSEHPADALRHLALAGSAELAADRLAEQGDAARADPVRYREAARALAPSSPSLEVAEILEAAGDAAGALRVLARLRRGVAVDLVGRLRLMAGRCQLALGSPRAALRHLRRAAEDVALRIEAREAIAQAYLRQGDHRRAVEQLSALREAERTASALELLGVAYSYLDEPEASRRALDAAAAMDPGPRSLLRIASFRAIGAYRRGDLSGAAAGYREAYGLARAKGFDEQLPTVTLNLATIEHRLGDLGSARARYDEAAVWARALGRVTTEVTIGVNHARLDGELGRFERARRGVSAARESAERHDLAFLVAEADALGAELAWAEGRDGGELAERAVSRFEALGARREVADTSVIAAHLALERGDLDAATRWLERAEAGPSADDLRSRTLEARARLEHARGAGSLALRALDEAIGLAKLGHEPELAARLEARAASLADGLGATHAAAAYRAEALAAWDRIAATLPSELRAAFWAHPFRAPIRAAPHDPAPADTRAVRRLLSVAARVAEALDPDAVVELAMDAAIELTGAERGFVLLADGDGFDVSVARNFDREDLVRASQKFSRTIADRVVAHGEPVLTAEAHRDERFAAGTSVHAMQLRSVLSVPIRTHAAVLGALYVDNRFLRGRFSEAQVELLSGFADHVAIALTNARLHRELEVRTRELSEERERIAGVLARTTAEVERLARSADVGFHGLVGRSPAMRALVAAIRRLADSPVTVLVEGESGTGKELVARAIHETGHRRERPFVSVNCGAIPESLLESELFGYVRGAFTGADRERRGLLLEAGEGTLLLDEVGEMPMGMQVKLLRALQQREVRPVGASRTERFAARVIAATNRSLLDEVSAGRFREDLYYRLAVVGLRVPALRERREDIPELARALLARVADAGGPQLRLSASAVRALTAHEWPGNVRQLDNTLCAASVFADGPCIEAEALLLPEARGDREPSERDQIARALTRHGWNVAAVSRSLGIPRMTLYRRLRAYGLERPSSKVESGTGR